jgi:TonB family protein
MKYLRLIVLALAGVTQCWGGAPTAYAQSAGTADYRSMLSVWLEAHKRYPESARVRGEEGRVVLRFRVNRSGRVLDYAVISGTGYPDLDAAAEGMMRGAVLPAFPPSMTAPEAEISVTVRFGLNGGQLLGPPPGGPALQTGSARDPLLDADHKKLLKNALDVCARAAGGVPLATEECFNHLPNGITVKDVFKDCPKLLAKTNASLCPDGPEKLVAQWEANRLADTISFRDFVLDKEDMVRPGAYGVGKAVVIRGVYIRASDSMDYLLAPGQPNPMAYGGSLTPDVAIPLLLDEVSGTSRETRAALLACREKYPPETFTGCSVILLGFVQKCTITMQLTNASHEAVCIKVSDVTVDPRS